MRDWKGYLLKRTGFALMTVYIIVSLNFLLFRALPGNAVANIARVPNSYTLQLALRREFGLNQSIWRQYIIYLEQLAHGNLGISFQTQQPVSGILATALLNTLPMVALGTIVAVLFGITVGALAAWRRGTALGSGMLGTSLLLYAMPAQWVGLMLIFAAGGLLPAGGMENPFLVNPSTFTHLTDVLEHMALPSLTFALALLGQYAMIARSSVLETLGEDYVLTARAKGLPARRVLRRHVLRNAMLPITTLIALSIGTMAGGTILIETVFSWPGIGRTVYQAVLARDYPVLQGGFLVLTLAVIGSNYIADLVYFKLDPRITE